MVQAQKHLGHGELRARLFRRWLVEPRQTLLRQLEAARGDVGFCLVQQHLRRLRFCRQGLDRLARFAGTSPQRQQGATENEDEPDLAHEFSPSSETLARTGRVTSSWVPGAMRTTLARRFIRKTWSATATKSGAAVAATEGTVGAVGCLPAFARNLRLASITGSFRRAWSARRSRRSASA